MPLARNISPYRAAPKVKPFNPDEFIASLENCGPQLTSSVKGDWEGLYRRFFKSPNFVCWYNMRHREVAQKLQVLHLESLAESRIEVCILSLKRFSKFFGRMHYLQHFNFTNFFFCRIGWQIKKKFS